MIEDLIQRTTIEFPGVLTLEQTEDLLGYVAKTLPADVNYKLSQFKDFFHSPLSNKLEVEEVTAGIEGSIRHSCKPLAFESFSTISSSQHLGMIEGIRFPLVPDWEVEDYKRTRPEVITLWDEVKDKVDKYFRGE